jgi:hypothetical protein
MGWPNSYALGLELLSHFTRALILERTPHPTRF